MIARDHETVLANMPETSSKPYKAPTNATPESALSDSYELGSLIGAGHSGAATLSQSHGKTEGAVQGQTEGKTEGKT